MTEQEKRTKLAEAMGWKRSPPLVANAEMPPYKDGEMICDTHWILPNKGVVWSIDELPDPFTDANDDYAVLERVRTEILKEDSIIDEAAFHDTLADCFWMNLYQEPRRYPEPRSTISIGYQIGDYARAVLKVIE